MRMIFSGSFSSTGLTDAGLMENCQRARELARCPSIQWHVGESFSVLAQVILIPLRDGMGRLLCAKLGLR